MKDPLKKGAAVRQVAPLAQGSVLDVKYDADAGQFKYLVAWDGGERWFNDSEVEAVPAKEDGAVDTANA